MSIFKGEFILPEPEALLKLFIMKHAGIEVMLLQEKNILNLYMASDT